jgi:hypothetical protein
MTVHVDQSWEALPEGLTLPINGPGPNVYLERQAKRESNARSYPRRLPLAISKAKGIYVQDVEGHTYIDALACAGALALGHNHPVVLEAIQQFLQDELPFQTLDLTTPVKDRFVGDVVWVLAGRVSNGCAHSVLRAIGGRCGGSGYQAREDDNQTANDVLFSRGLSRNDTRFVGIDRVPRTEGGHQRPHARYAFSSISL